MGRDASLDLLQDTLEHITFAEKLLSLPSNSHLDLARGVFFHTCAHDILSTHPQVTFINIGFSGHALMCSQASVIL